MNEPAPLLHYRLTAHAKMEMLRRGITEAEISTVLSHPEQMDDVRSGRVVYQSKKARGKPSKVYLMRVIVDVDLDPPAVVTIYCTSKIEKYWRDDR
jgi:hypothetical protein